MAQESTEPVTLYRWPSFAGETRGEGEEKNAPPIQNGGEPRLPTTREEDMVGGCGVHSLFVYPLSVALLRGPHALVLKGYNHDQPRNVSRTTWHIIAA